MRVLRRNARRFPAVDAAGRLRVRQIRNFDETDVRAGRIRLAENPVVVRMFSDADQSCKFGELS